MMARAIAATTTALAAFTALVLTGAMTGIDEWAVDHVMPALDPTSGQKGIVQTTGLWRPFPLRIVWWQKLIDGYNYPASVLVSAVIVAAAVVVLVRHGRGRAALVWVGAWCAANAVELFGKYVITRPAVYWTNGVRHVHLIPFDNSYPSGHTERSVVLAAIVAYAWPRVRGAAAVWVALVPVSLVVGAAHTVSDVVGGMLVGLLLVLAAHAMIGRWTQSPAFSSASSGASWAIRSPFSRTSRARASSSPTGS